MRAAYDNSTEQLSAYYDDIGPREGDIGLAFALAGNPENAVVLEIGCGNGRDAAVIVQRTPYYTGIDTSQNMIAKAQARLPDAHFVHADAVTYDYPATYDIVFAFAPLRHLRLGQVTTVLQKVYDALRPGGILYISSNFGSEYKQVNRSHPHGVKQLYLYNPDIILECAPTGFQMVKELRDSVNGEAWFEIALKKMF